MQGERKQWSVEAGRASDASAVISEVCWSGFGWVGGWVGVGAGGGLVRLVTANDKISALETGMADLSAFSQQKTEQVRASFEMVFLVVAAEVWEIGM